MIDDRRLATINPSKLTLNSKKIVFHQKSQFWDESRFVEMRFRRRSLRRSLRSSNRQCRIDREARRPEARRSEARRPEGRWKRVQPVGWRRLRLDLLPRQWLLGHLLLQKDKRHLTRPGRVQLGLVVHPDLGADQLLPAVLHRLLPLLPLLLPLQPRKNRLLNLSSIRVGNYRGLNSADAFILKTILLRAVTHITVLIEWDPITDTVDAMMSKVTFKSLVEWMRGYCTVEDLRTQ